MESRSAPLNTVAVWELLRRDGLILSLEGRDLAPTRPGYHAFSALFDVVYTEDELVFLRAGSPPPAVRVGGDLPFVGLAAAPGREGRAAWEESRRRVHVFDAAARQKRLLPRGTATFPELQELVGRARERFPRA